MISVLMPVYRVPMEWFGEALGSTLQCLDEFEAAHPSGRCEVVIACDGSDQEDLLERLERLPNEDHRIRVVHTGSNLGVAGALNAGLDHCTNDLVARMDADDVMRPGRLGAQYAAMMRDHEVDALGTGLHYLVHHEGVWKVDQSVVSHPARITREEAAGSLWFMNHPTVMFRRASLEDAGGYDSSLRGMSEDYELWVRMLLRGMRLRNLQEPYHLLRINPSSASRSFNPDNHAFLLRQQAKLAK